MLGLDAKGSVKQSWRTDGDIKKGTTEENKGTPESTKSPREGGMEGSGSV